MKHLFFCISLLFISVYTNAEVTQPFKTCAHIKENVAYQTMLVTKKNCDVYGVVMSDTAIYKAFMNTLSSNEASPTECNAQCLVTNAFSGQIMSECVDSYAKSFAQGVAGNGNFTASTCSDFKSRFINK